MTGKSAYSKEELVDCGYGRLFGPGNARLPVDNMLMLDRITHISSEGGLYDKTLPQLLQTSGLGEQEKASITGACKEAVSQIGEFVAWLEKTLGPREDGN